MGNISNAQIEDVSYKLKYNNETCFFDLYLKVNSGSATTPRERAQFNSQVSFILPEENTFYVEDSYLPLQRNQHKDSDIPTSWEMSNEIEDIESLPGNKLVSVAPFLNPAAFYNDLNEGDELRLFSFKSFPITDCGAGIRLFDNENDPTSAAPGMRGGDFRNGFTLGGASQKFTSNLPMEYPAGPTITSVSVNPVNGTQLSVEALPAGDCQSIVSYEVAGPNGKWSLDKFSEKNERSLEKGSYFLIATDEIGCKTEVQFDPFTTTSNNQLENGAVITSEEETIEENTEESSSYEGAFTSSIFPNPSKDVINLMVDGYEGTVVSGNIYDMSGNLVQKNVANFTMNGEAQELKIQTGLNPGIYTLALTLNEGVVVNHKVLIIK